MRHLLLIIGNEIKMNKNYTDYIVRIYESKFKEVSEMIMLEKNSKELPFLLEKWIKEYEFISIFVSSDYYGTSAKVLATLNGDSLVLKDEILVPIKSLEHNDNGFLMAFSKCRVNLIKLSLSSKFPNLLGDISPNFEYFCLLDIDEDSAKILLDTIAKSYEISIQSSSLLENLVLIKATSLQYGKLDEFLKASKKLFSGKFIPNKNPLYFIVSALKKEKLKISFAESCTGGLCASEFTKIEGVSEIFEGSVVSYSNRIKHEWLGISETVLEANGEYSQKCVYFMLKGIFKTAKPDFALALSGVLGNDDVGGIKSGTVFVGAMYKDGSFLQEILYLNGDREFMQKQAVLSAFCLLLKLKPELFIME